MTVTTLNKPNQYLTEIEIGEVLKDMACPLDFSVAVFIVTKNKRMENIHNNSNYPKSELHQVYFSLASTRYWMSII
jgi:hypothetical protein